MNQTPAKRRLKAPSAPTQIDTAWDGDLFARRGIPDILDPVIERLGSGVIFIDAPWGEGKTWFAKNWHKHLSEKHWPSIYIDAFANDYLDDPFLLITAEINKSIKGDEALKKKIVKRAAHIAKAIIPLGTSILVNIIGRIALGDGNLAGTLEDAVQDADDKISDNIESILAEKLQNHENEQKAVAAFNKALTEYTQPHDKPLVIFIDELDRCKPTFAIKLLERVKHFFDVPKLVFVLLLNRDQLEKAIKGVYGSEVDAAAYLHKFVDFTLPLPRKDELSTQQYYATKYAHNLLTLFNIQCDANEVQCIDRSINQWARLFDLSLRDIERIFTLLALTGRIGGHGYLRIYLAALKVKHPKIYASIAGKDLKAHDDAIEMLKKSAASHLAETYDSDLYNSISSMHSAAKTDFKRHGTVTAEQIRMVLPDGSRTPHGTVLQRLCADLDNQGYTT